MRCCIRLVRGEAVELVDREITAIATEYPPDFGPMISSSLRTYASAAARLAGSDAFGRELSHRFARAGVDLEASRHALEEIERGTPERIDAARMREAFGEDADALLDTARPSDAVIAAFGRQLGAEIYRLESIIRVWLLLHLVERHDEPVRVALKSDLRSVCARGLDWLKLRGLWSAASAHLKRTAGVMTAAERRRHERELALLVADNAGRRAVPETRRIRVSMLGTIEVVRPGAEPARPKGARLRQLLGVLSADAMLEHRLTNPEFYMLAAEEQDIDRARSTVYMAMHRLREMLGPGAIVTDAETPRFDRELVHVDIVEASARLHEARSAARDREWLRASTALLEAFELIGSEVAFPGLYDDFFEAAREDFEGLMRATAVRVGRGLLAEGDPENAEEVVRRALEAVPEDEELSELLTETLVALGRRTDAALLRRRRIAVE
jgi:DNA-binding SARP family transcriptional activator